MKNKQIQSYVSVDVYAQLKQVAEEQGLLVATLIRQLILNYLKQQKND